MVDLSIDLEELPELLELYKKKLQDTRVKLRHSEEEVASLRSSQSQPRLRDIVEPESIDSNSKLPGDLRKAQDELNRARSRANVAEGELMIVGDKLDQQEQDIANLQAENGRLHLRIEQLQEDSVRAKRDVSQLEEEAGQLRAEIKRITDENQQLSAFNAQQKAVSKNDYDQEHARLLKVQSQFEAQAGVQYTTGVARDEAIREGYEIQHDRDELQATVAALKKSVEAPRKERDALAKKLPSDDRLKWMAFKQTMQKMPHVAGVLNPERWRNCIPHSIPMNYVKAQEYLNSAEFIALCNHNSILYAGLRLLWFMEVQQHAFLVTSTHHPNSDDKSQWERNDEYDKLVNRTLEVVYTPDGVSGYYVGTYRSIEGPKQITLRDFTGYRDVTTHGPLVSDMIEYSKIQNPRGSFATERMIGQLYEDGTATLDVLGLQCVGYNNDLNRALQDKLSNLQAERDMPGRAPSSPVRLHRVTRSSVLEISGRVPPGVVKRPRGDSDAAEASRRQKASRR